MGICCNSSQSLLPEDIQYKDQISIRIKLKDHNKKVFSQDRVDFILPKPIFQMNKKYRIADTRLNISSCLLGRLDPRQIMNEDSQDSILCIASENTAFLAVFDGHGAFAMQVLKFCSGFMEEYFENHHEDFVENAENAIHSIIAECDSALYKNSEVINIELSGTTIVVVFINDHGIHTASLGDSRAILATIPNTNSYTRPVIHPKSSYARKIPAVKDLEVISLTVDQRPNHESEFSRIGKSGGIVQQITDDFGHKAGPFRVWEKNGLVPGLSISRSIGDKIARQIGVISDPIYHFFPVVTFRDQFIVMASKGLWEVMTSQEVVDFVENFRKKCLGFEQDHGDFPVRVIAR